MANISQKYAQALYDVAKAQDLTDSVLDELTQVAESVKEQISDLKAIDNNPKLAKNDRQQFVDNVFKGASKPLLNTLYLLANNSKLSLIPEIHKYFSKIYNQVHSQDLMKVESVYPLSNEELDEIGKAFIKRTGLKKLILENQVNDSLIGGIRVSIGTKVYDGSIQNDLNQLAKSFQQMK
ncbi:F0F1 ATP synthase subunit delta [Mammaliicoccus sciuri]|uniref:F0F1 ATP synthase subunit delta n=1 Tax=Mammaliicoccus sciuri TaxID=1296 RepID=UPI001951DDCA|nr:F0F1 ATP synthase subunit delta [Mammaliicoccus sciuri]